jgi:putative ABC transport system permease protein
VTQPPGSAVGPTEATRYAKIAAVSKVEPVQHRYAYVGADLQDLYGVNPKTIVGAGKLQDAYVAGGSASSLFARLAAQPDAILVSAETVKDFQLLPGDQLTLRMQDTRTNRYADVRFHYAGVVKEFPTAPRDSFLIANATYVAKMTGSDAVSTFLVDANGNNPQVIADRLRTALGTTATVTDITSSRTIVGSSLTAVDLAGLTRVELAYALALAVAASGLTLWLGLAERRRIFAIAAALGARARQVGAFVWIEATIIAVAAVVLGGLGGWALTNLLVKVLTGVFDPAPAALTVPVGYLAIVAAVLVGAVAVAARAGIVASQRDPLATPNGNAAWRLIRPEDSSQCAGPRSG